MNEIKTLDIKELAVLLKKKVGTIYNNLHHNPERVPPPVRMPGSARLLWIHEDVVDWLKSCTEKKVGRPRKKHTTN